MDKYFIEWDGGAHTMGRGRLIHGVLVSVCFSGMAGCPDGWQIRSSPSSSQLNGIAYGNELFVAVGSNATILTSTDGVVWTRQPIDTTTPILRCAAFGNGRYVVGGGEAALIRSSTDGIHWTIGLSTLGAETINAITFGYTHGNGLFVAVGRGPQVNTSYILTSSNGIDWAIQTAPTTNTLWGVAPAFTDGIGWAEDLFVAVGDRGTIITSTNGTDWVLQNSGTTVPLRAVLWHWEMLVGGDSGVVLASSEAMTWSPAAPTSFSIRGLGSSPASHILVAVGNYQDTGRLHVSTNGIAWTGTSCEFTQPLNGITYGNGTFVAVGDNGLVVQSVMSTAGQTNEWTKPTSGYWEELSWSLGELPSVDQALVAFRNPGFKALAIGPNTSANFSNSLTINNLKVEAPADSFNELLLNFAGLDVPLVVNSEFILGTNASLVSYHSALRGGELDLSSQASFSNSSTVSFTRVLVGSSAPAELNLADDSTLSADMLLLPPRPGGGTLNQSGGSARVTNLQLYGGSTYNLAGGTLVSSNASLGAVLAPSTPPGSAALAQYAGVHTNANMTLFGEIRRQAVTHYGTYSLSGGLLVSDSIRLMGGAFTQSSGTNLAQELILDEAGSYVMNSGELVTSNTTVETCCCVMSLFAQNGGAYTVQDRLMLQDFARYELRGGTLNASNFDVGPGAELRVMGGVISNSGLFTIRGGAVSASGQTQQLGRLQVIGVPAVICESLQPTNSTLDVGVVTGNGPTVLRFRDSRDVHWSGSALSILHWSPTTNGFGPDHIFVGTNSQGLTASQVNQLSFLDPFGWPLGKYPARVLTTGEIVPGIPPPVAFTNTSAELILSWAGDYYQLVSATNVLGPYLAVPGASSPFTNAFTDPQRFFRLSPPS